MVTAAAALNDTMNGSLVLAHSISSRVELDYARGTAHKTYAPPAWVRVLYAAAFQARFPYEQNPDALEAARLRRQIAGILTEYWFGWNVVAPVLDVTNEPDGRIGFVTQLVHGAAPTDRRNARRFLGEVTARFLEAGLPTWQVTPHNPRAVGNLIDEGDGRYRIIDLESNLVAPLMPVSSVVGSIRQGTFPNFDDIDVAKLNTYVARHASAIAERLGSDKVDELRQSAAQYEAAAGRWYSSERRWLSKAARLAFKLVDVPTWIRALKRMTADSGAVADRFVERGVTAWEAEGYIDGERATELKAASKEPEVASALTHLGAHMAMTVPLRFPFGSIARAGWTLVMRAKAEWNALVRRKPVGSTRQEHTLLVAGASLVPTLGAAAYMLSKPLRSNRALAVITLDQMMRKTPLRLYERLHLAPLMVFQAQLDRSEDASQRVSARSLGPAMKERLATLQPAFPMIAAVLAANGAIIALGAALYFGQDTRVVFDEKGLMNTSDALQLVAAGAAGIASYALFWKIRAPHASLSETAGIFFWGISGAGLVALAADDYFGLHERVGDWMAAHSYLMPMGTHSVDDAITIGVGITGLSVLYLFRHELVAPRASSTLLLLAVPSAMLMVAADAYGVGVLRGLEFPGQVAAVGFLFLAHVTRLREVTATAREPRRRQAQRPRVAQSCREGELVAA